MRQTLLELMLNPEKKEGRKKLPICILHCFFYFLSKLYLILTILYPSKRGKKLPRPVISVGNIVVGGTGKTPFVETLAKMLVHRGYKIAILSRGYKRKVTRASSIYGIVSDGRKILLPAEESGDEPQLLARNIPDAVVITGKNRFITGNLAIDKYDCDILILDDGFQYRELHRDMDIVIISASLPFGNGHLLPRGILREPKGSLERASLFLLTHVDECTNLELLKQELKSIKPNAPIIEGIHSPVSLEDITSANPIKLDYLTGRNIIALSSIGYPKSFENKLRNMGANIKDSVTFEDHHRYSNADFERILQLARDKKVEAIVTTQKDAVRIEPFRDYLLHRLEEMGTGICILALLIRLDIVNGTDILKNMLETVVGIKSKEKAPDD